ncbi:MAG TPA: DMT family transporter [Streptosporangiaceae bacterium]|nr:DMT family transporter [Streptosporangiaceae bacterium]
MNINRRHAVAALIAAGLLWGTTVPLTKLALEWLSPAWLTVVRFGLAAAVLLAALLITGRRRARRTAQRSALRRAFTPAVLAAGALGYGGSVVVQNAGITRTSVTHAALLIGAVPVLVAIIAAAWHRTVARPVAWFGFAVSLGGVGLVTAGGGGGGATLAGDGLVLMSLVLSATVTVAQGRLLTGRDPVAVTAVQFLGAALGLLPVAMVSEGAPAGPAGSGAPLAVVALALAGTLLPFTLFAFGQSRVSAEVAGAFLNLEPLVGAIAGVVVFGDPAGLAQAFGGMAILAGIALSSLPLLAGRRVARRAVLVAGAGAAAASAAAAGTGTGRVGAGVGTGRLGAEVPRKTKPPSPEPALVKTRAGGCDSLTERSSRESHSSDSRARRSGRNGAFVKIRAGKFAGAGQARGGHPSAGRPAAGRPPVRGRSSGRRPGEPGRRPRRRGLPQVRA